MCNQLLPLKFNYEKIIANDQFLSIIVIVRKWIVNGYNLFYLY